jgi:chromosome segregation ATPase
MSAGENSPELNEALEMHNQAIMYNSMIGTGLIGLGQTLKIILDDELYKRLGYSEFGEYTEKEHNIKERQAYNHIRLVKEYGVTFLQSSANANIGITKLLEIAALDKPDREKLFSEYPAEELAQKSTKDVKELVAKIQDLEKQLSFLESAPKAEIVQQKPFEEIEAEIRREVEERLRAEYDRALADAKSQNVRDDKDYLVTVAEERLENARRDAERAAGEKVAAEIQKLKDEKKAETEKAKAARESAQKAEESAKKARDEAEKAKKDAEQARKDAAELPRFKAQLEAAQKAKEDTEKRIKLSANPEFTRFKFLFDDTKNTLVALIGQYEKLGEDDKPKGKLAVEALIGGFRL